MRRSPSLRSVALATKHSGIFGQLLTLDGRAGAAAESTGTEAGAVRREILALYDGREEPSPDHTRVHRFAEMPLNHLGYALTYWDVSKALPAPERSAAAHGIITWFRRPQSSAFYGWA